MAPYRYFGEKLIRKGSIHPFYFPVSLDSNSLQPNGYISSGAGWLQAILEQ
jgi:hypothetical protein